VTGRESGDVGVVLDGRGNTGEDPGPGGGGLLESTLEVADDQRVQRRIDLLDADDGGLGGLAGADVA
jgi:hypothetical protein